SRETLLDVRIAYPIISREESHKVASGSLAKNSQRSQTSAFSVNAPNRHSNDSRPNDYSNMRTTRAVP
nr:hypothetical protein [Tanacetum cinerariifolium]